MPKEPRVIFIEWVDSVSYSSAVWTNKDAVIENAKAHTCRSVGFLLKETDDKVTIAAHVGGDSCSGDMTIPKVAIKKRRWLSK